MANLSKKLVLNIVFIMVFVPFVLGTQEELKKDSEFAIKEAVDLLEKRKNQTENLLEQKKISEAILLLEKLLPKQMANGKTNSGILSKKFGGKATYDSRTKTLSLFYDFKSIYQLRDFENSDKTKIKNGNLLIPGAEEIKHIGKFKTAKLTTSIYIEHVPPERESFLKSDTGLSIATRKFGGHALMIWYSDKLITERRYPHTERLDKRFIPITLTLENPKVNLKFGKDDIAATKDFVDAGSFSFLGGQSGITYGPLTITGVPDESWFEEFVK